jgi:N-acetylglucosamine repressor
VSRYRTDQIQRPVRKINPKDFSVARRSTGRDINRRIALNLIRAHQPLSRADLARRMNTTRGVVGVLVNELMEEGLILEGAAGKTARGRKPVFLYVRTGDRLVVAADVRVSRIDIMLSDFSGRCIALETLDPILEPADFVAQFARRVGEILERHSGEGRCEGIGVVIPGMVARDSGRVLNAPQLGWRNVDLREPLARATGLPVFVESAARACALAQMWLSAEDTASTHDFIYISVSDGLGTGLVLGGELVRGNGQIAGEFGHMPLSLDGPRCACGATGCWMAYVSNLATISRYVRSHHGAADGDKPTVTEIIQRARAGDVKAMAAIQATARYLGLGLVTIIHGIDPACVYIGGEITTGWDLVEPTMRAALAERSLTDQEIRTVILPSTLEYPRLRGAAALVAAPTFAVPRLA